MNESKLPLRDKQGNVVDPAKMMDVQVFTPPPGIFFSTSDTGILARLGLNDSVTAPCGGTIPTCAVADGKTMCGCGRIHPAQIHSVNLPAIFEELGILRERVKALESQTEQPEGDFRLMMLHALQHHKAEHPDCPHSVTDVHHAKQSKDAG